MTEQLWPLFILLLLTIGVFLNTREPFEVIQKITLVDSTLAFILLSLFAVVFSIAVILFFRKKN